MIRYKDNIFENYFINPYTAVITNNNGKTIKQTLHKDRYVVRIHGIRMPVYQIQAHTYYGWRSDKVVHHIDENHKNDILFNLYYEWTSSEHIKHHNQYKVISEVTKEKISKTLSGRKLPKDHVLKVAAANKGKKRTEETRKLMSLKASGKNNQAYGKRWWNDGTKQCFCKECPRNFMESWYA